MNGTHKILFKSSQTSTNLCYSCKILRDATPRSLVILDGEYFLRVIFLHWLDFLRAQKELGRGTSTYVSGKFVVSEGFG